jgi:hypothetical protein
VCGEPMVGLEPTTSGLQNRCSTTELHRPTTIKHKRRSRSMALITLKIILPTSQIVNTLCI